MKWMGLMLGIFLVIGMGVMGIRRLRVDLGETQVLGIDEGSVDAPIRGVLIPHHMLVRDTIKKVLNQVECVTPCSVVFISPLHQGVGITSILWVQDELKLAQQVSDTTVVHADESQIEMEHTIQDVVPIIETSWPELQQTQIMVSNYVAKFEADVMAEVLAQAMKHEPELKLIVSVDFSHYLPVTEADKRDEHTLDLLSTKDYGRLLTLNDEYVDGTKALYVFLEALAKAGVDEMEFLGKTNSGILMNNPNEQSTSHFYAVFR